MKFMFRCGFIYDGMICTDGERIVFVHGVHVVFEVRVPTIVCARNF